MTLPKMRFADIRSAKFIETGANSLTQIDFRLFRRFLCFGMTG
jgi:hypothetical protein